MLGEGIQQPEGDLLMVMPAMQRIFLNVIEGVVHPAHVPLAGKAQATFAGRLADTRPGGGLFGDDQRARHFGGYHIVQVPQKIDGFQILPPAMPVGNPLAALARIVPIQHGRHRIDPQPIHMVFAQPVQRRGQHEAVHLGAAQIVDMGIPIRMPALERVGIFVERGTVE